MSIVSGGGYENVHTKGVLGTGFRLVSRFDTDAGEVTRFTAQLQKPREIDTYETIPQLDHDPISPGGHDVYSEGIHIDVYRRNGTDIKLWPSHAGLPDSRGKLLRWCSEYLEENAKWLGSVHLGVKEPTDPPRYP